MSIARSGKRIRRKRPRQLRRLTGEALEPRFLLAGPEGSVYTLPQASIDTVGLVGSLSAKIDWGDGQQTNVSVSTPSNPPNKIRFKFDYSLDTNGFFNSTRRAILEDVGRSVTQYFTDTLTSITPSGQNTWTTNVCHPSQGPSNQLCGVLADVSNRVRNVAANEIVVFAGARDIIGNVRGTGGFGGYGAVGTQAWLNNVAARGQSGALQNPQTDIGPWGGSITFDNNGTDWYYEKDVAGIGREQVDFRTVAAHELLHVLGFGQVPTDKVSSWERLTTGTTFTGNNARNAYIGSGFPPVDTHASGDGPAKTHWDESIEELGQLTLMRGAIETGTSQVMTRLDLAALDDLGWQVQYPQSVSVQGNHVYADDGVYDVTVIVSGSVTGQMFHRTQVTIDNVDPQLTVPGTQTVVVGETLTLPEGSFEIADPGFGTEQFAFGINWSDGSELDGGFAQITQEGNATRPTLATFSASHTFDQVGTYPAIVTVIDDDDGRVQKQFVVQVIAPPDLTLSLSANSVAEDAGAGAAQLTVTRSGPPRSTDHTIQLRSSDSTEATVPETVVIKAGDSSATVDVFARDDTLLDGTQTVLLSASATGAGPDEIQLQVTDAEFLELELTADGVFENDNSSVLLKVRRSNTDRSEALDVSISGGNSSEIDMPESVTIEPEKIVFSIRLAPVNDDDPELTQQWTYQFSAPGYQSASIVVTLFDDEPPLFQNSEDRFDVDGQNGVSTGDALRVINELAIRIRQGLSDFDPESEQPNGTFLDVTGDYKLTSLDALQVINEVALRRLQGESEFIPDSAALNVPLVARSATEDDETLTELALDPGRVF